MLFRPLNARVLQGLEMLDDRRVHRDSHRLCSSADSPCCEKHNRGSVTGVTAALLRCDHPATAIPPGVVGPGVRPTLRPERRMGGQPGEQGGVGDAGLASEVHHRQLAGTEDPGKGLRADP